MSGYDPRDPRLSQLDSAITRSRLMRVLVFGAWILLALCLPAWIGSSLSSKVGLPWHTGLMAGLITGITAIAASLPRFIVVVSAFQGIVTVDNLKSLFGKDRAYVSYGPGFHISFPWESRQKDGNVSLLEATEDFSNFVQLSDDKVEIKGSIRLRPDVTRLPKFIGGAAAAAADIVDIVRSTILANTTGKVKEVIVSVDQLNEALSDRFGSARDSQVKGFEERFGLVVGDATIATIEVSDELRKTMTGLAEANAIAEGTAIILGFKNMEEVRKAVADNVVSQEEVDRAKKEFLAATENITMDVKENIFHIKGLDAIDPGVAKAITQVASSLAAGLAAQGRRSQSGGRRNRNRNKQGGDSNA